MYRKLAVDPNTVLVQVQCSAPVSGSGSQIWAWGKRVSDFALADATGSTYPCIGVWATVQRGAEHYFVANYKNLDDKNHLQAIICAEKGEAGECVAGISGAVGDTDRGDSIQREYGDG